MKIGIDVSQMCYEGSGVGRYVQGLTRALLTLPSSHTFLLFAGTLRQRRYFMKLRKHTPWNKAEWKMLPLPPKVAGLALNALSIPFEWLTGPVDLIHASDWSEPYTHLPMVTTVHDLVFAKYPETLDPLILETQTKRIARIVRDTTHIIADSESTKNDLMKIYGLSTTRITVIYPGIEPTYVPQSKKEVDRVKKIYHLPEKYILSLGTQEPRKNLDRLVAACTDLPYPLVITGKQGWGKETSSEVRNLGYVAEDDLPALYSGAEVFVYPSLYEGFGFPVLEAMACGVPVVTSNTSSLPEVAGVAAILVDPLDVSAITAGIRQALAERHVRSSAGVKQAKKFTWDKTARAVLEVYEKTANRH